MKEYFLNDMLRRKQLVETFNYFLFNHDKIIIRQEQLRCMHKKNRAKSIKISKINPTCTKPSLQSTQRVERSYVSEISKYNLLTVLKGSVKCNEVTAVRAKTLAPPIQVRNAAQRRAQQGGSFKALGTWIWRRRRGCGHVDRQGELAIFTKAAPFPLKQGHS